jgi:hypothetical protein
MRIMPTAPNMTVIPKAGEARLLNIFNLILRSARRARLEGWMHGTCALPSFETALRASSG